MFTPFTSLCDSCALCLQSINISWGFIIPSQQSFMGLTTEFCVTLQGISRCHLDTRGRENLAHYPTISRRPQPELANTDICYLEVKDYYLDIVRAYIETRGPLRIGSVGLDMLQTGPLVLKSCDCMPLAHASLNLRRDSCVSKTYRGHTR